MSSFDDNCDTCIYILKCDRASSTGTSLARILFGCPKKIKEQNRKDQEKENNE